MKSDKEGIGLQTNTRPKILVVLPTLGQRSDLLRLTLKSITSQAPEILDIVIVCPKKDVLTRNLAKEFNANMVDDPGSLSAAINEGVSCAKKHHEYITWIGDDDLLRPGALHASVLALDRDSKAVLAFGYCDYIDSTGRLLFKSKAGRLAPWLMTWGPDLVPLPGIVFRLTALHKAGSFDTSLKYAMDLDMLLRLRKQGKFVNTKKTVSAFRWHPESTTVANRSASLDEAEMVKRRYMSKTMRSLAPVWEKPVRLATKLAVLKVNSLAQFKQ